MGKLSNRYNKALTRRAVRAFLLFPLVLTDKSARGENESLNDFSVFARFLAEDALNNAAVLGLDASDF
jgi:hypothetical protein